MTRLKNLLFVVVLVTLASVAAQAQSVPTRTTLSSAQAAPNACSGAQCTMVVGSATGINTSTTSLQSYCLVDSELEQVVSASSTTFVVRRSRQGLGAAHPSGASVVCGYMGTFNPLSGTVSTVVGSPTVGASVTGATFVASLPVGTCTRANNAILPVFNMTAGPEGRGGSYGYMVDCLGGRWIAGTLPDFPPQKALVLASNIPIGSVAYGSIGTNTTDIAGQEWLTSIYVPQSAWITGIKVLAGGTATTDNILGILRDSNGALLANSATAGVLLSGANTFQTLAFTAARFIVGPALYFVGIQGNGTTAGAIQTIPASTFVDVLSGSASGTFGTVTSTFTVPTTFTATKAPVVELYY